MTAIGGMVCFGDALLNKSALERSAAALSMYGSDAVDHLRFQKAGFFRCLLKICPEDRFDRQPLSHPASGQALVFDGRIDNREDLAGRLRLTSEYLRTCSDADLVLKALICLGPSAMQMFRGDYALALWRANEKRLLLARSPMGHRPLYWHRSDKAVSFATMPKGIFALTGIERKVDSQRMRHHLALFPPTGDSSFFENMQRVLPGWSVEVCEDQVRKKCFHKFKCSSGIQKSRDNEYLEEFEFLFKQAVSRCLRSIGGVASHLSAGLDSGSVTSMAATLMAEYGEPLLAYTAVPSASFTASSDVRSITDEGIRAALLASRFPNIDHYRLSVDSSSLLHGMEADVERLDGPPLNPCNMMWLNAINRDASSKGCSVVLTGMAGNMTVSRSGAALLRVLFLNGRFFRWVREVLNLRRELPGVGFKKLIYFSASPLLPNAIYRAIEKIQRPKWSLDRYSAVNLGASEKKLFKKSSFGRYFQPSWSERKEIIRHFETHDNGDYFAAANAFGVEMRDPTADVDLTEFMLCLPEDQLLRYGKYRWLLRRVMSNLLPEEYFDRSRAGMQAADWRVHLKKEFDGLRQDISGYISHEKIREVIDVDELSTLAAALGNLDDESKVSESQYRYKFLRGFAGAKFVKMIESDNR